MLTSAFNQFINPWAIDAIGWRYYIAYCAWLIVELVFVIVFVVETKGMLWLDEHDIDKTRLTIETHRSHARRNGSNV